MTEAEWLACSDPQKMLQRGWGGLVTERKSRLFAAACCRRLWRLLPDEAREAVEVAERLADGLANRMHRKAAERALEGPQVEAFSAQDYVMVNALSAAAFAVSHVSRVSRTEGHRPALLEVASCTANAAKHAAVLATCDTKEIEAVRAYLPSPVAEAEQAAQAVLLRCVVGNPFRPAVLDGARLTPEVLSLAHAAYDESILPEGHLDPVRLAVLADALEEAGCADGEVLGHLRGPGVHVRGCHAVDLVLARQ